MADQLALASLQDQVVVVTGGGRGIGRIFAQAFAGAGAAVAVTGRSPDELAETVARIEAAGGRATSITFDVADRKCAEDGMRDLELRHGRIDLLVNNAGLWGPIDNLWEADPHAWWRTMEVHVAGTFHCSRAILPGMLTRRSGRIINIVSGAGVYRWPTCSAYSVSKAAVIKLTENLSVEVRGRGIAVFAFHPGLTTSGLSEQAIGMRAVPGSAAERASAWIRGELASGRSIPPERAAAFLLTLATGQWDGLSGRYLAVSDDLHALQARLAEIQRADLLTLRLRGLSDQGNTGNDCRP